MSAPAAFKVLDESDSAAVAALDQTLRRDGWSTESWALTLRKGKSYGLVRQAQAAPECETELFAFAAFQTCDDEAELLMVAVDPREQRRGYARRLLATAISRAREAGVKRFFLEVETTNRAALSLYERLGFVWLYRRYNYYGEGRDADVMQLRFDVPEQPET